MKPPSSSNCEVDDDELPVLTPQVKVSKVNVEKYLVDEQMEDDVLDEEEEVVDAQEDVEEDVDEEVDIEENIELKQQKNTPAVPTYAQLYQENTTLETCSVR